jgi:hypothetical protein
MRGLKKVPEIRLDSTDPRSPMLFRPAMREQHTCSDRVHTAGNGEEPAIQFRTRLLIRLQQLAGQSHPP